MLRCELCYNEKMNYIGSKITLLPFIEEKIEEVVGKTTNGVFCDIFSGTTSVAKTFKKKGYHVITNDLQTYSLVFAKYFIENSLPVSSERIELLNHLHGVEGFISQHYSGNRLYFSKSNAQKIDVIRQQIESWRDEISDVEYNFLLTSLLEAVDKVANTTSIYEAYLKELKDSAKKDILLKPLVAISGPKGKAYNEDANQLIQHISGDILYLDPPYNTRRYDTNYHLLETIALYDKPEIKGKAGLRVSENKKSRYSSRREAAKALEDLIRDADFSYIFLSYNDEGIIPIDKVKEIMESYGHYQRFETEYKRYKSDNKRIYKTDKTIEYLHVLEKG